MRILNLISRPRTGHDQLPSPNQSRSEVMGKFLMWGKRTIQPSLVTCECVWGGALRPPRLRCIRLYTRHNSTFGASHRPSHFICIPIPTASSSNIVAIAGIEPLSSSFHRSSYRPCTHSVTLVVQNTRPPFQDGKCLELSKISTPCHALDVVV